MSIDERLAAAGLPTLPRGVWLEIDEDALATNLRVFRELGGPGVELNAVVKADAYGHGLRSVGMAFQSAGADRLCVASFDEALALRNGGVTMPILVLFSIPPEFAVDAARNAIEITASDMQTMEATLGTWRANGAIAGGAELRVHVEVETGLTRGGIQPEQAAGLLRLLAEAPGVETAGIWTHLATPEDESTTAAQITAFEGATKRVREARLPVPPRHVAATGGLLTGRAPAYEGVRIGLGLYGLVPLDLPMPAAQRALADRLRPAMALKARALRIERFPAGVSVSYGGRWTTERDSVIATLPVGYADAIPRPAPWGEALVNGHRVPLVGNVAMDAVMADVTDVRDIGPDDEFVLLGSQGSATISAEALSRARNTIPWEVATSMSYRLPRVYHAASVLMGVRTINAEARVSSRAPLHGDRKG